MKRALFVAVGLGLAVSACGEETMAPESDPALAIQSGDAQSETVGQALGSPVVVRVSRDGQALAGATVNWSVTAGGGSVNPTSSTTGSDGLASTSWTLGATPGTNSLEASVSGATNSPVTFTATGESGTLPTQVSVDVGDNFFNPGSVALAAGGEVTWTWTGAATHNVTFSSGPNSATQSSGTFSRTFADTGSFDYTCTIHGSAMSGTVVVQ